MDVNEEDETIAKESSVSELGSERTDDDDTEEYEEKIDKSKEFFKSHTETDNSCSTSGEVSAETAVLSFKEMSNDLPVTVKPVKSIVSVTEVNRAVDEIIYSVCHDTIDTANVDESEDNQKVSESSELDFLNRVDNVTTKSESSVQSLKPLIFESSKEDPVSLTGKVDDVGCTPIVSEVGTEESVFVSQSIPHLKKEVMEENIDAEERPMVKSGRGRKKDQLKDGAKKSIRTLDMTGTSLASSTAEIPMLEPMEPAIQTLDPVRQQKEPSPYDFEEDSESSWKPEITKKWEPSASPTVVPSDPIVSPDEKVPKTGILDVAEEEEKEKKKVKKKAKKKPISPEFVEDMKVEESSFTAEVQTPKPLGIVGGEEPPASDGDVANEKIGPRKKGRKKKDSGVDAKKEVIDQYENTVNSVVEAVKHSLQEADSDLEHRPVKRRRPKRVSESDSKDLAKSAKLMRKLGARKATKASEEVNSEKPTAETPNTLVAQEPNSVSALPTQAEEEAVSSKKASSKEPSFCESQGFEPQTESQEGGAAFENTPPTTPEHDESSNSASLKHPEKGESSCHTQHHSASSLSESSHQKDLSKVACPSSSATSSLTLSASSTTIVNSHVQSSTKSSSESPSDNDVISTASTDNLDSGATNQQSESSGTDQDTQDASNGTGRKRRQPSEGPSPAITAQPKKKKRVHGTRSRTARKSPKCEYKL